MPSTRNRFTRRIQRHVERYTPDGTIGRVILALTSGIASGVSLFVSLAFLFPPVPISLLIVPIFGSIGLGAAVLTLLMVWPVYLSVIGNVDSPTDYAQQVYSSSNRSAIPPLDQQQSASHNDESDDALVVLRNRYARGEISEQAFERRLEQLLATESIEEAQLNLEWKTDMNPQQNRPQSPREQEHE